jgi:hypothetical protein
VISLRNGQLLQNAEIDRGTDPRHGARGPINRGRDGSEPGRKHLVELGQGAQCRFAHGVAPCQGSHPQAGNQGHRLIVLQHEGRQAPPAAQPIAACHSWLCLDRIPQVTQSGDVTTHGAPGNPQALGELISTPGGACLQQSEEPQDAMCGLGHATILGQTADRTCPH